MASNGNARNRKFSEECRGESFQDDPYARTSPFKSTPPTPPTPPNVPMVNSSQDSPVNGEELNPAPPMKIPTRAITAVESRLLSLATKEKPEPRRSRADSNSDNESSDKRSKVRRGRSRSLSQSPRRKSRSPDRKRGRSPEKKGSPKKSSAKKKSPAGRKQHSNSRSRSRSPSTGHSSMRKHGSLARSPSRRKHSRSPPKRSCSKSRDRKRSRSKSRSHKPRKRSRSKSRERRRSSSRSRGKRRSRSRDRKNGKKRRSSPSRSRSRSRSPKFTSKWGQKPTGGVCRAVLPENGTEKKAREVTTEDVEKRLAQHMKQVQEKAAEDAKKINLPGYLNPAMVNVHQFKQVQDKKKLLWGKTKEEADAKGTKWAGAFDDSNNDGKFRRLMGIHQEGGTPASGEGSKQIEQSRKVLDDLEKEYEKSRAFQLSRGAGGLTGIGLGFGSSVPQQPPQ